MASSPLPPVFFVYGAFGTGKSTLAPLVAAELTECLVLDVDWLLAPLSRLARRELTEDPESWPALRDFWLVLASIAGRSGRSTVFFGPEEPANVEGLPSRSAAGESRWLLLDCADGVIRERLARRAGWKQEWTLDSLSDAARFRALGTPAVRTDKTRLPEAAALVAAWVRAELAQAGRGGDA